MTANKRVDVDRLSPYMHRYGFVSMEKDDDGEYVSHTDYAALLQQLAERDGEVERLTRHIEDPVLGLAPLAAQGGRELFDCDGERFIPVSTKVLTFLRDPEVIKRAMGRFSPRMLQELGFSDDEAKVVEYLYCIAESFDFDARPTRAEAAERAMDEACCLLREAALGIDELANIYYSEFSDTAREKQNDALHDRIAAFLAANGDKS